jgi:hypothetical protein
MIRSRRVLGLLSLVLMLATGLTSCSSSDSITGPSDMATVRDTQSKLFLPIVTPLLNGLLACNRQSYDFDRETIGPAGGTLRVNGHVLSIPAGALSRNVTITATAPAGYVASVDFEPEGLQFSRPVKLTLDYSSCPLGRLQLFKHVAYTTDHYDILDLLSSVDDILRMRVSADVRHFSRYAVAW